MIWSVFSIDAAAYRAFFARVAGINSDDWNTSSLCLVGNESTQLPERPVVQASALFAAGRNPSADTLEILKSNSASGAFSIQHDSLRNTVIGVFLEPRLSSCQFAQPTFSALCADFLEAASAPDMVGPDALDRLTAIDLTVAAGSNIDDPHVNADPPRRLELDGFWNVACAGQQPFAANETEIGFAFAERKQRELMFPGDKAEPHPAFESPDRKNALTLETEDSIVIGLRSVGAENWRDLTINLEGIGYFSYASDGGLSRETESASQFGIGELLQIVLPIDLGGKARFGKPRACFVAAHKRRLQFCGLLAGGKELDGGYELHTSNIEEVR